MATRPTAQQCHALTTYFIDAIVGSGAPKPRVNRNKARWGWESLLMDYTPSEARSLIDYYIKHYTSPTVDWFLYNYEKVDAAKVEREEEEKQRRLRREATKKRLEQWENRWKK